MKIAILGAGAMGSWFGGSLVLQGQDVNLLSTNRAHLDAINQNGLILKTGGHENRVKVKACHPENHQRHDDLVILFTKSFQSEAALAAISSTFDENTRILTLQNGLGNIENINQFIPAERILVGVTMMPVDKVAPGIVESTGHGASWFNSAVEPGSTFARELEQIFNASGLEVQLDPNIHGRIWSKVAFNAGMNAVSALAHGTPGSINDSPGAQELVNDVAREVATVARAEGVDIDLQGVFNTIDFACKNHGDHKPSMHQDLVGGRRTEVDALNGAIVKAGQRLGVATPLNAILETLVRVAELSHQRYPPE